MTASSNPFVDNFRDPNAAARYADGPRRFVPALADVHRMTGLLLAERAGPDASILVVGAGGGLELRAMAEAFPTWRFVGVDPAAPMLAEAARVLGPHAERVQFVEGYIDDAPEGPFDGATCLLTLHFLEPDGRRRTAEAIRRRLKPGAPFVAMHSSFPQEPTERARALDRYAAFAVAAGADPEQALSARHAVASMLPVLSPEHDEALLREAGFTEVSLFYAAFSWRGWVAYA